VRLCATEDMRRYFVRRPTGMLGLLLIALMVIGPARAQENCDTIADITQPYVADDCTIGLWHFDEDYGSTVDDASTNNLTGFLDGEPDWGIGQVGFDGAMHCGGTNYLHVPDVDVLTGVNALTLECWFKLDSYGFDFWNYLFEKGGSYTVYVGDADEPNRDKLWAKITTNTGEYILLSSGPVPLDTWSHVAITYDGSVMQMYINGELEVETAASGTISESSTPLFVGANNLGYQTNRPMHGWIDEARISNVARKYEVEPLHAAFDVLPRECPNYIWPVTSPFVAADAPLADSAPTAGAEKLEPWREKPARLLQAAILGSPALDVSDIDRTSVALEGSHPVFAAVWDIIMAMEPGAEPCDCISNGHDGLKDLVLWFDQSAVYGSLGEVEVGDQIPVTISGWLHDGTPFAGVDCVIVIDGDPQQGVAYNEDDDTHQLSNCPNPFNPTTEIVFSVSHSCPVRLEVINALGQRIEVLLDEQLAAGEYRVPWHAGGYASGVYFYRLMAGGYAETRKMIQVK